jgi:hypothetical protein
MPARAVVRRLTVGSAAFLVGAAAAWFSMDAAHAANDEIRFAGPWKLKFKGGGTSAPGAVVVDAVNQTTLTFDPGFSSPAGGSTSAVLVATRKFTVVDGDGGNMFVGVQQYADLQFHQGAASADVAILSGSRPVLTHPLIRQADDVNPMDTDFNWNWSQTLKDGTYTLRVTILYKRAKTGRYGLASRSSPPHSVRLYIDAGG